MARRVEVVSAEDRAKSHLFVVVQAACIVGIHIVAAIPAGILEGSIGVRALVRQVHVGALQLGTVDYKSAPRVAAATLQPHGVFVQRFTLMNVHDTQTAEVAVLRAEGPARDRDGFDQLPTERFERTRYP